MISNLSNIVARYLLREKIIEEKNMPVYSYGFEIIISTVIGVVLILLIGVFTSSLFTAAIFYCLFIGLRFFTGGYHADTHFRCKLPLLLFAPVEHLNAPMTDEEAQKNRIIAIAMALIMFFTTMVLSFHFSFLARIASLTQFVVAVLIIISKVNKGGDEHERTEEESSQEGC